MLRHRAPLMRAPRLGVALIAALIVLSSALTGSARAAGNDYCANASTTTYDGPTNGTWGTDTDSTNWSGGLPNANCLAVIPTGDTVTLTTTPGEESASTAAGGSAAGLTVQSGATLIVEGVSSQGEQGNVSNTTGLQIGPDGLVVAQGATLDLEATANASPFTGNAPGQATGGAVQIYPDGSATASVTNQGTINVTSTDSSYGVALDWTGTLANTGTFNVGSGALTFQGQNYPMLVDNTSTMTVAAGASLTMNAGDGSSFTNAGTFANQGTTTLNSGGDMFWAQTAGSVSGNPVNFIGGAELHDSAGAGGFDFTDCASGYLSGAIPAGQTVTVIGGCSGTDAYLGTDSTTSTVVNNGTLDLVAAPGGADAIVSGGELDNHGTVSSTGSGSGTPTNQLRAPLVNESDGSVTVANGILAQNAGTASTNNGTVTVDPGATWLVQGGTFTNTGTLALAVASAGSLGQFDLTVAGNFYAGGTLVPTLPSGFVPSTGAEFPLFLYNGGTFYGTFASTGGGFSTDYSKETASTAYVGAVYGSAAPAPGASGSTSTTASAGNAGSTGTTGTTKPTSNAPTAVVRPKVSGGAGGILVKVACRKDVKSCDIYTFAGTVGRKTVAGGGGTVKPGKSISVTLKLNATGARLLKKDGRLKVKLVIKSATKTLKTTTVTVTRAKAKVKTKRR